MQGDARQRVFFALWPDASTRKQLAYWRDRLHRSSGGRKIPEEDLHLTLAFMGDSAERDVARAIVAAEEVTPRRFDFLIDVPAYWKHNRIVWAGTQAIPDALSELTADLRRTLVRAGVRFDAKPFVPHITLLRDAADFHMADLPPIDWCVECFALVHSQSGVRPRYRVLRKWAAN
jgi:RNA 2',3'-cyclic 3'-phosphodiesterase